MGVGTLQNCSLRNGKGLRAREQRWSHDVTNRLYHHWTPHSQIIKVAHFIPRVSHLNDRSQRKPHLHGKRDQLTFASVTGCVQSLSSDTGCVQSLSLPRTMNFTPFFLLLLFISWSLFKEIKIQLSIRKSLATHPACSSKSW